MKMKEWHKKNITIGLLIVLIALAMFGLYKLLEFRIHMQEIIIDSAQVDDLEYVLMKQKGVSGSVDYLVINRLTDNEKWERIYQSDFKQLKPWKIEIADIDGDHQNEILIGVNKTTHFDDQEKNRMFIFNFNGEKLYKKWTGSQIAGVWDYFFAQDLLSIPGDELLFIEQVGDTGERVCVYYWFDFGFVLLARSEIYEDIKELRIIGENRLQITLNVGRKEETRTLKVDNGEIIELNRNP